MCQKSNKAQVAFYAAGSMGHVLQAHQRSYTRNSGLSVYIQRRITLREVSLQAWTTVIQFHCCLVGLVATKSRLFHMHQRFWLAWYAPGWLEAFQTTYAQASLPLAILVFQCAGYARAQT